jgi:hypothetical protein
MAEPARRRSTRGVRRAAAIALSGAAALVLATGSHASAGPSTASYTATADARLVAAAFTTSPGVLFDQLVDVGSSAAQAQIDSLGGTSAFASDPYPGATVLGLPGLLASGSGGQTSALPAYPLVAASDQTTPSAHRQLGPLALDAQSQGGASTGTVNDGARRATARTTFDADTGETRSHAESTISSLQLTTTLSVNGVHAVADAVKRPSGPTERTSSFEVSSLTVLGQQVAVTRKGLRVLGADTPLVADPNAVLRSLLDTLASQGTSIQFLPAATTDDGVTSAGLRITTVTAPPAQAPSGLEAIKVQYTLGQASAAVTSDAFGDLSGIVAGPLSGGAGDGGTTGSLVDAGTTAPGPVSVPAAAGTPLATTRTGFIAPDISVSAFYPVLLLAGAIGLALVQIIRQLGVREP